MGIGLRRSLRATGVRVIETRSMADCRQRLSESSGAAVSLEWRADTADSILELLARWDDEHPEVLAIVTAVRGPAEIEELVREAGAAWFVNSVRQLPALAAVVARPCSPTAAAGIKRTRSNLGAITVGPSRLRYFRLCPSIDKPAPDQLNRTCGEKSACP